MIRNGAGTVKNADPLTDRALLLASRLLYKRPDGQIVKLEGVLDFPISQAEADTVPPLWVLLSSEAGGKNWITSADRLPSALNPIITPGATRLIIGQPIGLGKLACTLEEPF